MVTLETIFLDSNSDPYRLLSRSIAAFEDKNDIVQSSATEDQAFPTAWFFEMYEKFYLLQLNESFQRCEGSQPNY